MLRFDEGFHPSFFNLTFVGAGSRNFPCRDCFCRYPARGVSKGRAKVVQPMMISSPDTCMDEAKNARMPERMEA